jgi:hypothetical protein
LVWEALDGAAEIDSVGVNLDRNRLQSQSGLCEEKGSDQENDAPENFAGAQRATLPRLH